MAYYAEFDSLLDRSGFNILGVLKWEKLWWLLERLNELEENMAGWLGLVSSSTQISRRNHLSNPSA